MTAELPQHLLRVVETICNNGCQRVNEIIDILEAGDSIAETDGLSAEERDKVLAELRHIMSVYERK